MQKSWIFKGFLSISQVYVVITMRFWDHSFIRVLWSSYKNFSLIRRHTFLQSKKVEKVKISPKPNLGFEISFFPLKAKTQGFPKWCITFLCDFSFQRYRHFKWKGPKFRYHSYLKTLGYNLGSNSRKHHIPTLVIGFRG